MPHLTVQLSARGPLLDVMVGVSGPRREALTKAGLAIPNEIQIRGLIDTGASSTALDQAVIAALGLVPTGTIPIHTPSTQGTAHVCNQYDVRITLVHPKLSLHIPALPVIDAGLATQGIQALIGRDVLERCLFIYNGQDNYFSLSFLSSGMQ